MFADILALRTRFVENAPAGVTCLYDNQPDHDPSVTEPFIRMTIQPGASRRESFGPNGIERLIGRIFIDVHVPRQIGDARAHNLADQCAAIFRNWRSADGAVTCGTPDFTVDPTDPQWFRVKVSIPWDSQHRF